MKDDAKRKLMTIKVSVQSAMDEWVGELTADEMRQSIYELGAWNAHDAEIKRLGAIVFNHGWAVDELEAGIQIASKTSLGVLTTSVDYEDGSAEHQLVNTHDFS